MQAGALRRDRPARDATRKNTIIKPESHIVKVGPMHIRNLMLLRRSTRHLTPDLRLPRLPINRNLLLLEIPPILLINQHEVQVVAGTELLVDVAESWGEVKAAEEEADGDGLPAYGRAVHDLELGDRLALVVLVRWCAGCFAADDGEFHVLDLYPYQEEVDLADDDVFQVVSGEGRQSGSQFVSFHEFCERNKGEVERHIL